MAMSIYEEMLQRIAVASHNNPSITLINNSPCTLILEVGDIEKDEIRSCMPLYKKTKFTFSPYAHPFCLKKKSLSKEPHIKLITPEQRCFNLHINTHPINFGDTIRLDYDKHNNTMNFVRYDPNHLKPKKLTKTFKRSNLPKRCNTVT
jgi:hypothetical protein